MTVTVLLALAAAASGPSLSGGRTLVWADEFNGTSVDPAKWSFVEDCWGGGNEERQCYVRDGGVATVTDGLLTITARRRDSNGQALPADQRQAGKAVETKALPYSSAKLVTKGKAQWTYGRFEIRARLPTGQGTWPAIWMLPEENHYGPWAASGEIDILEAVNLGAPCSECPGGLENRLLGTLHFGRPWPGNAHKGDEKPLPQILNGAFHIFALDWSPRRMVWTVDGLAFAERRTGDWNTSASIAAGAPFDRPFYLILNLAVGGGLAESRDLKTVDPAAFPARFEIDWVRVWQCPANQATGSCSE